MSLLIELANNYFKSVHAVKLSSIRGEPEAQLTIPVSNLFCGLVEVAGLGRINLIRESRLDRTRPDFAVLHIKGSQVYQKGYIELKAPDVSIDTSQWIGRNALQWENMKREAEILIVCNGQKARIFKDGEPIGSEATLPYQDIENWNPCPLTDLIGRFLETRPRPVTSISDLSNRLALRTADLRDRLLWLFEQPSVAGEAALAGYASWKQHVHPEASERDFADGISQVIAYGMALAALSGTRADTNGDGHISIAEARYALRGFSPVMAAAFAPLIDKPTLFEAVQVELGALETLISAINPERVNRSADSRGEPWLYFYEDFLSVYDAVARRQAGVYFTPIAVVRAMVNMVDHLLVERFDKRLGFADPAVVTLDPATGTGTFPLAVIDQAVKRAQALRGKAGQSHAVTNLAQNLFAFELLPGPYSVAHLRLTQRLHELAPSHCSAARVVLTDTLESPLNPREQLALFGDAEVLAAEQNRAKRIKLDQRVTVIIANPPYRRVERQMNGRGSGGWVVEGVVPGRKTDKSLFDDILDVAKKNTIFSHHASLYNLYVYFWRWAIWKAFESQPSGPGVVAFITGSSWLTGPGFVGLRKLVRESCDEVWVLDLGGDNHGANPEENVFAIETPVAIVVLVRTGVKDRTRPAQIHYRRVSGTAVEKLAAMEQIAEAAHPFAGDWLDAPIECLKPFAPPTGHSDWFAMPSVVDIFPFQQPGSMYNRSWPIAPHPEILRERWRSFVGTDQKDRPAAFSTAKTGRNISTRVGGLRRLIDLKPGDDHAEIVPYGYRSFDRQWTFKDPRIAALERPVLWASRSEKQIFLTSLMTAKMSTGPCMTATPSVPDKHHFRGSFGGKDVIPLYLDGAAKVPNLTKGLTSFLKKRLNIAEPTVEDIAAYTYSLLSSLRYEERFSEALKTPGPRIPITADSGLWEEAVQLGRYMLWLHTFGERFRDSKAGRGNRVPVVAGIGWEEPVAIMPQRASDIIYNSKNQTLRIGDGLISGVRPAVWTYTVSGMEVVKKWLEYRTVRGAGKATSSKSSLDRIRPKSWPDEWNEELLDLIWVLTLTLDKQPEQADLLDRICKGPLLPAATFPKPKAGKFATPSVATSADLFEPEKFSVRKP